MYSWIPIAVAAGSSMLGGYLNSQATESNANASQTAALTNANSVKNTGILNATMIGNLGKYNANLQMASSRVASDSLLAVARYNAGLQQSVSAFNISLMENELPLLMDQYELDSLHIKQERAREKGSIIATQAASGTVIGIGSNAEVVIDQETQAALDQTVLRHNLDITTTNLLNSISSQKYTTQMAIEKTMFEAQVGSYNTLTQGRMNAMGTMGQTLIDRNTTLANAEANAGTLISQGNAAYTTGQNQSSSQLWSGVLSGIGTAATMYAGNSLLS